MARLLTRYTAAWSTLPYCGDDGEEASEADEGGGGKVLSTTPREVGLQTTPAKQR